AIGEDVTLFEPVGTLFIRLIFMVVVPLVFASLFIGTASLGDIRKLGRIGARTLTFYLLYTAISVAIGLALANTLRPGVGLSEEAQALILEGYGDSAQERITTAREKPSVMETLLDIVPTNPLFAISGNPPRMLQIIFFAMFLGIAVLFIKQERKDAVVTFFEGINDAMIVIVHVVIKLAPYGVFALIAAVVGQFGFDVLLLLIKYTVITCAGLLMLNFTYAPVVRYLTKLKLSHFLKGIWPAQGIAFSTSSSSATLPVTIECCTERLGVSDAIASFVLPLGATINMNGTALYQGVSAVFIAQVYGIPLSLVDQLVIVLTATLASVGAAGVPGIGMMMLVIVLQQIGIPVEGIALVLGVERILDMFRTTVNITGDAAAATVIAHWEGELRKTAETA
ncbi:MAG: dicarboxylate/amino acid:cation symporter, partial [Acidobacteriota bacterium]